MDSDAQNRPESPETRRERAVVAAQACEYCRSRKTKCDEGRPKCATCHKLGIDCVYDEPRPTKKDRTLVYVLEVLQRIDDRVSSLCNEVATISSLAIQPTPAAPLLAGQVQPSPPETLLSKARLHLHSAPMKDIFSWPTIKEMLDGQLAEAGENLETLRAGGSPVLQLLEDRYTFSDFTPTTALESAPRIETITPAVSVTRIDFLSLPLLVIQQLSAAYFNAYNPLFPILDPQKYYSETLPEIAQNGFADGEVASVTVLLVAALGQLALEGSLGELLVDEAGEESGIRGGLLGRPPGLQIFNEAQRRMGLEMTHYRLEHVQMFSLAATYYAQCFRHADFWRMTQHACGTYEAFRARYLFSHYPSSLLNRSRASENPEDKSKASDEVRRAYWLCFMMQSGVLLDLRLPLSVITNADDDMPLPNFRKQTVSANEENYYMHFLAQISLSRILARIRSFRATFNVQQSSTSSDPTPLKEHSSSSEAREIDYQSLSIWISEMDRQLDEWRDHLPDPLKWNDGYIAEMPNASEEPSPLDPLFVPSGAGELPLKQNQNTEVLIAILRSKYLHAKFLIWLPILYKALHSPDRMTRKDVVDCTTLLKYCMYWPVSMSPPRDKKRLVPQIHGWTHCFLEILVILYVTTQSPILRFIFETDFSPGEVEESAALMLDWIRDTKQIDPIAQCAWRILSKLYPVN